MADPANSVPLRIPGKLVKDPTDVTDVAGDYGGTLLGLVRDVLLLVEAPFFEVRREDFGPAEFVEALELGARWELRVSLRNRDDDAFSTVFRNTFVGATDGLTGARWPDTSGRLEGAPATDREIKLLYAADDPAAPSVYLRSAIPLLAREIEIPLSHTRDALWLTRFVGRRDPSTQTGSAQYQVVKDIVL